MSRTLLCPPTIDNEQFKEKENQNAYYEAKIRTISDSIVLRNRYLCFSQSFGMR